jgi:hypothetical protein
MNFNIFVGGQHMKYKLPYCGVVALLGGLAGVTHQAKAIDAPNPIDVPISISVPCKPNDAGCNAAHGVLSIAIQRGDEKTATVLSAPQRQSPDEKFESREWHASLTPGSYSIIVTPRSAGYVKAVTYGGADLMHGQFVIRPGVKPEAIKVTIAPGGTIEGVTTKGGKPYPGRVFDLTPPEMLQSVTSLRPGRKDYPYTIEGRAPGPHMLCALDIKDVDALPGRALDASVASHCKGIEKTVTVQEGKKVHADLEVASLKTRAQ